VWGHRQLIAIFFFFFFFFFFFGSPRGRYDKLSLIHLGLGQPMNQSNGHRVSLTPSFGLWTRSDLFFLLPWRFLCLKPIRPITSVLHPNTFGQFSSAARKASQFFFFFVMLFLSLSIHTQTPLRSTLHLHSVAAKCNSFGFGEIGEGYHSLNEEKFRRANGFFFFLKIKTWA
jgi:hypothetical protein